MASITMENGNRILNMEVEFGHLHTSIIIQIPILESGRMEKWKDMEYIHGVLI